MLRSPLHMACVNHDATITKSSFWETWPNLKYLQ